MDIYIKEQKGYAPQIGHLVSQMDYARKTTLDSIEGCTQEELYGLLSSDGNTIGALLLHMAAIERGFQIEFFDGRNPNEEEMEEWARHTGWEPVAARKSLDTPFPFILQHCVVSGRRPSQSLPINRMSGSMRSAIGTGTLRITTSSGSM
ncbi:hypothetical protein BACI349Y_620117 [Bacillus sp. 349Y]|nr:hypothetical protein BACI349Y_620117 [Bacillus sp. 349Y]